MEFLDTIIGLLVGLGLAFFSWRPRRPKLLSPQFHITDTYDERIDTITEEGKLRLKIHRADLNEAYRDSLCATNPDIHAAAAKVLGWDG